MRIRLIVVLLTAGSLLGGAVRADDFVPDLPDHDVADPSSPKVTTENLLLHERYWPYRVTLTKDWHPDRKSDSLQTGIGGVLVRVEKSGLARIDFGRYGIQEAPVEVTDLIVAANRIRTGELEKRAPNFLFAIAPRLADSGSPRLVPMRYRDAAAHRAFLCVFVDPNGFDFVALATVLGPLQNREGLLTIVFPMARQQDQRIREDLKALEWTVPFVFDQFAEPYTRRLIGDEAPLPYLLLQSDEGRTLFESEWRVGALRKLNAAIDAALPDSEASGQ